ncbi:unnamed protein product [Mycena citricolor]|uniref:Uncharacterized protein n=1 Tax=Mycena citricolor TaxID=2018698 RepID=A0AAD2JY58_9AGAR|nr:unnamed protein product [Mycena citricolor]
MIFRIPGTLMKQAIKSPTTALQSRADGLSNVSLLACLSVVRNNSISCVHDRAAPSLRHGRTKSPCSQHIWSNLSDGGHTYFLELCSRWNRNDPRGESVQNRGRPRLRMSPHLVSSSRLQSNRPPV